MERSYSFSPELLRMMLSEEREKFLSALGKPVSWKELNRIRKNIIQITQLLDSQNKPISAQDELPPRTTDDDIR